MVDKLVFLTLAGKSHLNYIKDAVCASEFNLAANVLHGLDSIRGFPHVIVISILQTG